MSKSNTKLNKEEFAIYSKDPQNWRNNKMKSRKHEYCEFKDIKIMLMT